MGRADLSKLSSDGGVHIPSYNCYRTTSAYYPTSMQVTLSPHGEELLQAALARGLGRSPEEIVERALETIAEVVAPTAERKKTPAEAVADILELRKGVTLGGLKIKDLIHEGHKY